MINSIKISTPGRVCLFGEHQDYLKLPVIASAISLRISIEGHRRNDKKIYIDLPDILSNENFDLSEKLDYTLERDYFKSVVNVLMRHGFTFSSGFDCTVRGKIPINAGTSSSSALIVTWVNFLARMSDQAKKLRPDEIAWYAYEAEVLEFSEPGGMMDQYSTSFGGVIYLEFYPELKWEMSRAHLKSFVLGDSGEPKDTKYILARVKNQTLDVVSRLQINDPGFSLQTATKEKIEGLSDALSSGQKELLIGTIENRDITQKAREALAADNVDHSYIGRLLSDHQAILRDVLKISTPKIDRMIDASLNAGAAGAKINGSGGGGCMFAYAPDDPEKVAEAIIQAGGKAYIINADEGSREDAINENTVIA